ncbi:MAG: mobile mystery protein A [Verrucomicrobiae bacterium]|nr:mobile mystery protein A [Verrucomicrobiae bacterium]
MEATQLIFSQLEERLQPFVSARQSQVPIKGWIRAIREALGMTGKQFAKRLGVKPPRVTALERDEVRGAVTLETMRRAAAALDCFFVYAIVPRTSLREALHQRAMKVAMDRLKRVEHTMALEDQALTLRESEASLEELVRKIETERPRDLWDDE